MTVLSAGAERAETEGASVFSTVLSLSLKGTGGGKKRCTPLNSDDHLIDD